MKKIITLFLMIATTFSLSSCVLTQIPETIISKMDNNDNKGQTYTPCTEDFAAVSAPVGKTDALCDFSPAEDALYFFYYDSFGIAELCRATEEKTESIAKEKNDILEGHYFDGSLQNTGDSVYFTTSKIGMLSTTGTLFKYDTTENTVTAVMEKDPGFGEWEITESAFVYCPYEAVTLGDPYTYPYETYSLYSFDMSSGKEKVLADSDVLYFDTEDGKIYFVTYDGAFNIFSCETDGSDMRSLGKMDFEFDPDNAYDYINSFCICRGNAVMWGEIGDTDTQTDIIVYSLTDGTTSVYSFEMYSSNFSAAEGYAFVTMTDTYDRTEAPVPLAHEGIYRIDLSDGTQELFSNTFAGNEGIIAFDKNCVYTAMTRLDNGISVTEIYRIRKDESPIKTYSYKL